MGEGEGKGGGGVHTAARSSQTKSLSRVLRCRSTANAADATSGEAHVTRAPHIATTTLRTMQAAVVRLSNALWKASLA
jgi:hypothetical protein